MAAANVVLVIFIETPGRQAVDLDNSNNLPNDKILKGENQHKSRDFVVCFGSSPDKEGVLGK